MLPAVEPSPAAASFWFTKFVSYGEAAELTVLPEAAAIVPTTSVPPESESVGPVRVVDGVVFDCNQQLSKVMEAPDHE